MEEDDLVVVIHVCDERIKAQIVLLTAGYYMRSLLDTYTEDRACHEQVETGRLY